MNRWIGILLVSNALLLALVAYLILGRNMNPLTRPESKVSESNYLKNEVKNSITKITPSLNECYSGYLAKSPARKDGAIRIDWLIEDSGNSRRIEVISNDLGDANIAVCIQGAIRTLRFPPHIEPKPVYVSHQFNFGAAPKRESPKMVNTP